MKHLKRVAMVQFFLHDAIEFDATGNTTIFGPNGTGKSSMIDGIQIAMLGAHQSYLRFNAQTEKSKASGDKRQPRSIRDYCLGMFKPEEDKAIPVRCRRQQANTYITLVFEDSDTGECLTAGTALTANINDDAHEIAGLYVLPGVALDLGDHFESVDGDELPRTWKDFLALANERCALVGGKAVVTDKPETYIKELLHGIGGRGINPKDFLRAFSKSVTMKDIGDVSDFVRMFLVEAQDIDRQRAMKHVQTLRDLHKLIVQVEERINRLGGLEREFERVQSAARRMASLEGLEAVYEVESAGEGIQNADDAIEKAESTIVEGEREKGEIAQGAARIAAQLEIVRTSLNEDKGKQKSDELASQIAATERERGTVADAMRELVGRVGAALGELGRLPAMESQRAMLDEGWRHLLAASDGIASRGLDHMPEALERAEKVMAAADAAFEAERRRAANAVVRASQAQETTVGRLKTLASSGVELSADPARLVALLDRAGISSTPVCALVKVTDAVWQPAIEGFLKSNRESLIVAEGREEDALAIVRGLSDDERLYNARLVMPNHIDDRHYADAGGDYVGSMITGSNRVAAAYVRMLLSGVRKVSTDRELRSNKSALSADGMCSGKGTIAPVRKPLAADLMLGRTAGGLDPAQVQAILSGAQKQVRDAKEAEARVNKAGAAISVVRHSGDLAAAATQQLDRWNSLGADLAGLRERKEAIDLRHLKKLQEDEKQLLADLGAKNDRRDQVVGDIARARGTIESASKERLAAEAAQQRATEREALTRKAVDYDANLVSELRDEIDRTPGDEAGGYAARLDRVKSRIKQTAGQLDTARNAVMPTFIRFLETVDNLQVEERTDWRKAMKWTRDTKSRLEGTELVERRTEAANAKAAAEFAFRTDIAMKMREAIREMKFQILKLNGIMRACPPFANGERYLFTHDVLPEYKDLVRSIESSADSFQLTDDDTGRAVMDMLDSAALDDGKRVPTPLDDFRIMYKFDVDIRTEQGHSGWLSQRVGPGSNGEHRTPFYVVLGAALAHAYRLDPRKNEGGGLMLLDEAFYAMDNENTSAAAAFLNQLGLQLVMTGPSSEWAKLAPISDRSVDLIRYDDQLFADVTVIKEKTHVLLQSDSPVRHPDLLDQMEAQVSSGRLNG